MAIRSNQKQRTEEAITSAAWDLMAEGGEISLALVADRAKVSRATVYRYYSDPVLLTLGAASKLDPPLCEESLEDLTSIQSRVRAVARFYFEISYKHVAQFRSILAASMHPSVEECNATQRCPQRLAAIHEALKPVCISMDPVEFDALVNRIAMITGMEQLILFDDVFGKNLEVGYQLQEGLIDAVLAKYIPDGVFN